MICSKANTRDSLSAGQTIMVFTIVTIIFLPMSFIAAFFAINFEDWGDGLTIGYVSKYMFGIGLAVSLLFVASAFHVHDISHAWKAAMKSSRTNSARILNRVRTRKRRSSSHSQSRGPEHEKDGSNWASRHEGVFEHRSTRAPWTAEGGVSTAYRSFAANDDVTEWKRHGLERGASDFIYGRMSHERDRDRVERARLGMSPIRYGARKQSFGSGASHDGPRAGGTVSVWARPSLDERRERFSGDLERGRMRELSRPGRYWEPAQ